MLLYDSMVEDAALEWFGKRGYAVGHGPHLAPGEHADGTLIPAFCSASSVPLSQREKEMREAVWQLNISIQSRTLATLHDTLLPRLLSGDLQVKGNMAFTATRGMARG